MTAPHDLDRELAAFLRDGPTKLPDPSFDAVRDRMETTRQRVVLGPWRIPDMHVNARLAIGLAAVAVLAVVGINLLTVNRGLVAGPTASPAASAAAAPLPSPSNSPAAQVDASAPASGVEAPPSSGAPSSSASAALQPTPTPDPEAVRIAAAAGFQAAGAAHERAWTMLPRTHKDVGRGPAELWRQYLDALRQLQVPADTAADLQDLIRIVSRLQAISGEGGSDNRLRAADARYQTRWDKIWPKIWPAATRVRSDLGLPEPVSHGPDGLGPPYDSFP